MSSVLAFPRAARDPHAEALDATVATLAAQLEATAVARDRAGGHAHHERELIRASGLLALTVAREHGGAGQPWPVFYRVLRRLAAADSALAHVFGFHHLQLASVVLYGSAAQARRLLQETMQQRLFWGNALNPRDTRLRATEADGGFVLDGIKSYASGSVGSDRLTISALHAASGAVLIGVLPTAARGVAVQADWDAFGQRQTDSGSVHFERVFLPQADVLQPPGRPETPRSTLRSQVAQLIMANLYLGIAQGAFEAARRYSAEAARPWPAAGVASAVDDPYIQQRYAELWLHIRPAQALADEAAERLDAAFARGDALLANERGEVAIAVAEAKVLAHRASIEVSSQLFEATGASSTSERHGLDRFWRNARVHTLHDPVDYKLRDIGRHVLTGALPEPTAYS